MQTELYTPELLEDKSSLNEIFRLRVVAWENSHLAKYINSEWYPDGWVEDIDETSYHFVVKVRDAKIIAASRLSIIYDESVLGLGLNDVQLPIGRPFAYWSRLVIHPDYRGNGIVKKMDHIRKKFLESTNCNFMIVCADKERVSSLRNQGFEEIGNVTHQYNLLSGKDYSSLLIKML